ncbi:hypothetical protein [Streptomyces sp. KL118A]|uniref:hypothetical protein n=1 Tax=Streptomyces sp. KL118A TaxID=3045153 RepID=UPI00278BE403|nr:hypothetical protein [Streptomyces sp. KL118A]
MPVNGLVLHIDRDRVHAGDDDVPPHHMIGEIRAVPGDITIGEAVDALTHGDDRYRLASVVGGATWVLHGGPGAEGPFIDHAVALAVITEPCRSAKPRPLVDPDLPLSCLAGADGSVELHFRYLHDDDPEQASQRGTPGRASSYPGVMY